MPDLTSTLLALYQQILGGSSASEQASLEAACARRVIQSGLTIAADGTFAFPGNLVVGGAITYTSLALTGNLSVGGTAAVTGNVTLGGSLTVATRMFAGFPSPPATVGSGVAGSATGFGTAIFAVKNTDSAANGPLVGFLNSTGALAGVITQVNATTVTYNTSSDARLKDDLGPVTDLSALRAVVVHEFYWRHGSARRARGVFAQEAHAVFPAAVTPGSDATTPDGHLLRPWMTDYSKFVPDLIAGWQAHDAAIAALLARSDRDE